jgi:hypothetical protein
MAVFYGVPAGKTFMIAGPADVTVKGGEMPVIVDTLQEAKDAAPTVTALDPATAECGAADFDLVLSGGGFTEQTVIIFNGFDEPTTLRPDGTLTTIVKPSIFGPGALPVSVRNGPLQSQPLDFTFTDPGAGTRKRR